MLPSQGSRTVLPREKNIFWGGLVANVVAWGLLSFLALVRLKFGGRGCISNLLGRRTAYASLALSAPLASIL